MRRLFVSFLFVLILLTSCGTTTSASFTLRGSYSSTNVESLNLANSGSPKTLSINIYAFYLGTEADCSNLKVESDLGADTMGYDLYKNPLLFSANPAPNTYRCIALKMSDVIQTKMNSTALNSWLDTCQEDVIYETDMYQSTSSEIWKDIKGASITATGTETKPAANIITLFASTDAAAAKTGKLGLGASQVYPLATPITLPSKTTFYIDYTEGVNGTTTCKLNTGTKGFR